MKRHVCGLLMACMSLLLLSATTFANEPKTAGKHGIKVLILCTGNTCRSQMAHRWCESGKTSQSQGGHGDA